MTEPPSPVAGWYADPLGAGRRYWDGQAWTDRVREVPPTIVDPSALPPPSLPTASVAGPAVVAGAAGRVARGRRGQGATTPRRAVLRHPVTWLIVALVAVTGWLGWASSQGEERPTLVVTPAGSPTP